MRVCPICEKGKLVQKIVPYRVYDTEIGKFPAEVCTVCNEHWFSEETAKKIEKIEKEKGLFGLSKQSRIGYSGNSLIIRIPSEIARFMSLKKEKTIVIHPEGKSRLLIEV